MITSVKFASLFLLLGHLRCGATDKAELERLKKAYEAREAAQTEDIIYSFEFNKSAEIRATRKNVFYKTDYTYDTMEQFTNVPESFEPKVSEPYNRHQLWRIFNWYDKDKNEEKDNPYAKKYNKVVDRVKWFYKKLILDVEAQGKVDEETRWDGVQNRSAYQRRRLGKVEQLKQRLNWYGTPRTTSEKSILHRYLLQNTLNEDHGRCTESVSPWYKLHPPYTIADGRHMFWTWFDGSPEKRIPYAHPDYIYYDPRYEGLESAPINWTAREMDPLPWAKRRILGGYSNKWLWPPRTTPTDFWRPSKPTTWDISERSDYIYIYDEKNPRKIQYTKMESQMRDRMDSMAYEYWKSAEYRRRRKLFEEERAELLRDNNLTDSYSPEKRVLSALRVEVDPSRVLPGMHSAADRAIQKFARHFVACFAPTRRIWFNEELTLKPRFVANSSRRTVCPFDELYPTIVASNELTFYYTMKTTSTTPVSMESLYDGLDTTEEKDEQGNTRVESRTARTAQDRAKANLKVNKALDALSKLTTLTKASEKHKEMKDEVSDVAAKQRGRPKIGEVEKESKGKSALRKSKVNKQRETEVKSKRLLKRAKRNVRKTTVVDPEDDYVPMVAEDSKDVKERGSKDEETGEVMKHRMDEEDQKNYQEIQEQFERLQQRKANISKARFYDVKETTLKKKRKPTYHYTSLDEQEAERKWNEVQKKKALKGGGGKNKNKKRKQREVTDTVDEIEPLNRQFGGQSIITTFENSTPPFEYFQQKVYPSHNLSSAQLNDEEFCRKLIPILEEENKMLMNDIKRRATEHAMEMMAAQVNVSNISELNEDESSETEGTTQPMTTLQRRKRDSANNRYKIQTDNIYSFETIMTRKKREINQTNDEKLNKLKRNLEVYNLVDEWKEKQVDLAMVTSKERRLLNEIDRLRKEMNMSHGENDPWYKQAVTEAIRRENELKLKFKDEIDEWWSKERKERRAHEKEVIEKYYNQTDQNDNEDFDKEEERKNQEELNIIQQEHEKDMAERKAKGLPPDSYEKMLPIAEQEMAEEQKKYEEECKCAPKTVDELMKEFDADVDVEKLKRNLEVYDLIEKWKKRQQKKDEQNKIASKRKKREVHIENKLQRIKRKTGKDSDGEYVEDMSRYRAGKRIYKELHHKMKGYKGAGDSGAVNDVMSDYMKNKKYDNPDYRKKRDLNLNNSEEKVQSRKKRFMKESEESEQFDASDLDRIDRINAKLRKEGYDREAIMKECNVRKNEKGELEGDLNVNEETMVRKRRFVTENEESEQFDASDLDRIDRINAKLRKEGYDREAIMKECNVRKNEKGELEGDLNVNEETMVRKRRFVKESEESEQFDASDLDRIDRINAKLRKEGYDREAIMKECNVRKNEKGELEGDLNVNEETMVRKRRFVKESEESEQFDASDLDRIDRINAKLRKEGYDREAIMKECNVRKNEKGELEGDLNVNEETMVRKKRNINDRIIRFDEAAIRADLNRSDENDWPPENDRAEWDPSFLHGHRRRKRDITQDRCRRNNIQNYNIYSFETIMTRKKRDINQTNDEKLNKLKRNLEVYNLVDEWKEKQVDLAMVSSKERRLLNEIDRLRKEMNMSHGENDPWYKQAVTEAIRRENELKLKFKDEIDEWWSKERKERRAHEKEVIEKYYNQTDQNDNEDFDKEEERKNQEELNIIQQEHEKDMAERKAKGLPPDSYEKMLPIAEEEMAEEQKKYEEECKCAPKTVDELMKEFDADVDVEKLKRNLEVYDLIEKWKKKQQEKEEKNKPRKKREIHGFNKRMKRKCGNSQEDEDRSRGKGNEKVYQEFNYKLKNYKGENADDENTADVLKGLMKENAHLHATRKTGKPQDAVDIKIRDKWFKQVGDKKTYDRGLYFRDKRDIEHRKWRYNKVENFEERNVAEVDDGSALLNIHRRKRDIKNRCKMHNDEKSERYDIEKLLARRKREIQANTEKLTKLKRNLEVYNLIDEWKEKQVDLAMVTSKERRLLNEIDRLRKEMNMSHGENDPWYKQAVTEAIRRENELKLKFKDEIDEWWSKERKERRAHEKEVIEKYYNQTDQNDNEDFDKEEERKNQEELNIIQQEHEKDMAERKAKGLPPDSYEKMLPIAEQDMAEEQKKYEEECKCAPKTVDELMKEFDADVDVEKLKRNLEVYDLIEKWKKRQQKKDEQNKIASKRKKREVHIENKLQRMKRKTGKDSDGEYVEDMSRYRAGKRIYKELHHKMKGYKGAGDSGAVNDVMSDYMKNKKYDNPDYRKKRDLTANANRNCIQEDDFDIVDFHIRRYGNTSIYEYVGPPASQEKQLHQQQSWQQRCQKVANMFGIENFKVDTIRRKDELEKTQKELEQDEMNTVLRRIHQRKRNKALLRKRRDALNVSMVDDGLPLNTSHTDDKHVHLENELDRMVREYEEQQKKSPRRPKTRPTASSEYPLKEDFEPFIKSSKELREFEEREQARERFALYKNFKDRIQEGDKLEQRQNDYLAEFDTTPSTTTISARAREKIQNLRSFIKSQLDDTVKKFSEALILLNATTGANVDQTDVNVTTPEERDIVYHKVYEHNPDELMHKTDVTFDIIERNAMLKTTTEQPQTFSPWATHIQNYNRFEYEPVNNETTVVIFSEDETVTYSPMYGFHRYYHDLNSSVDSRTVAPTTYAFLTKDKTDSFTLPSYDAEGTVFTYNIHEFDENKTPTIQSPWDISQKENLTLYKYPTELLIERYNTHITESTKLATQMETTGSDAIEIVNDPEIEKDISDIRKFSPANMDEIKQYIDSVTKSRERFNKKNFEWDSENSAYTLIDETTTTKCPKIRQQNIEFIEALQNGGLRPSTREIITTELPTEKNTEETTVKTRGLKTYLQDILQKYSNEVPQGSAQKQENARLKQQLLQILELESKMNKLDEKLQTNNKESTTFQSKTKRPRTTLFCGLKAKLFNLLHKYTEEILNTNAIANNQTKKKYGKMKNVIRILVDNYSPGPETDILDPAWTVELTSKERKAFPERNSTNTNDEYHINLKQQIHHVLDEYPDDNKHDKTLKIMVRKALRDSFENLDTSEIDDDVVFNQTNFWDVSDYVTNDVCTDRRFKTGFRVKLRKLIRDFSKEILSKNNDLTSRERRVNKNIIQNIGAAVEAYSFGPETDALAEHLQKIEVSDEQPTSPRPKPLEGVEEKKNLRLQIENFMNAYKSNEHENTIEKESNTKLKKLVQDLIKDHSFEYSLTAEMQGLVKRLTTKEEVTVRTTTVLNTEEQREVEEERRRRVPTYDYYDDHEELATCKDPKTTLDYYELYKEKVTERTTTTLSESQQVRRDKYIKNVERMNHLLDQKVDEHAKKVLLQHTTKKRPRLTTPDSQETDETSEEEPFTYRTMGPIETRIEYEFSDSRDFEIPFHDITVTKYTERFEDGLYTPGQGFENRSTIPESDEYRRAQRPFRYELANPVFKDPNVPRYLVPLEMLTPETTTVDYYSFYRQKMKKTTMGATEPTKDPAALARYREKFIANVDAFNRKLSEEVAAAHTGHVKERPRLTTPDSEHTDEESEMEPFTFYTAQPTERRVEMEFSDSREYYVPLLGITLSTLLPYPENVYTPGQGFENRSTVPEDDEYARAQWRFKYDPQIEIDRQGLTFSHDLYTRTSRPPSSPSTPPTTLRPLHRLFARWRSWKDKPLGDRFDSLKQAVNKSRLGGQFDSLKQMVNSSLLSWKGKVDGFVNRIDRRAHRIMHAWYDVKDNCSVEH